MTPLFAADLIAITVLVFAVFQPRHHRRDLVTAYLGVNVGVMAVGATLASVEVALGLGLGLFGVLSIIRLRSDELGQQEIAYYFAALALGLIGGIGVADPLVSVALIALVVVVMYIGDHPRLLGTHRSQFVAVDRAFTDELALVAHLERVLGAEVRKVSVRKLDLVSDTTSAMVHYVAPPEGSEDRRLSREVAGA